MGALHVCHAQQTVTQQVQQAQCVSVTQDIRGQTQVTLPLTVMVSELYTVHLHLCLSLQHIKLKGDCICMCVCKEPVRVLWSLNCQRYTESETSPSLIPNACCQRGALCPKTRLGVVMMKYLPTVCVVFIGASLSEPHTSVTALCLRVCIYAWTDHIP